MKRTVERKGKGTLSTFHFPLSISFSGMRRRSHGFTLIEMLVVIVIIMILMGVVFKLSKGAMEKNTYAKELKRLAILRTLIEEFPAEYTTYPPVHEYEIGGKMVQPVNFTGAYPLNGDAADLNYYPSHYNKANKYFMFGLMSAFVRRDWFCQQAYYVAGKGNGKRPIDNHWKDEGCNDPVDGQANIVIPQKDKAFTKRVRPILEQIYDCHSGASPNKKNGDPVPYDGDWYNRYVDIDPENGHSTGFTTGLTDSWGHEYVYICKPPHTTYLIFSKGPDNDYDREHPGDRASAKNRDNIYGNLGDK